MVYRRNNISRLLHLTFVTISAAMSSDVEQLQKKKKNPSPPSLLSLPEEIVVNCLARISKSYYPKLSLVCKTICSLILSMELYVARLELETHENVLHVCLQLLDKTRPSWRQAPSMTVARANAVACVFDDKIYSIEEMDYVYDPKEGKWDVPEAFVIESLATLNGNRLCYFVEIANYGGKLLILWGKFAPPRRQNKNIWCAVIALERGNNDEEVWGKVEWASVVLTVPKSYVFLRCEVKP
ncbi:hypothetical protein HID58_056353, partial [Brassica napus]